MPINASSSQTTDDDRRRSQDPSKKEMWSSMLNSVASGKRLPERNILVLGGSSDTQKEFLETLSSESPTKRASGRHSNRKPPVANDFALGYTYHDVLDADHEDVLARLSLYLLVDSSPAFTPLLRSLLTPETIPNTLIVILLDWAEPWLWLRQLKDWVRLLRILLVSLSPDCKAKMEEVMIHWRDRGKTPTSLDNLGGTFPSDGDISLPLGPGEWEEALGLPLCVVCQNSDQMESLERERGWKEEEFDFVLQTMRTILLKHGASLIYTIPTVSSQLQPLIHSSLGIQSLLNRQPLKHNVIDRHKVVVPPNWDSWGKIRVLREGFDVEQISQGWSFDIEENPSATTNGRSSEHDHDKLPSALAVYEETIQDPRNDIISNMNSELNGQNLEVESQDPQAFLGTQLEALEQLRNTEPTGSGSVNKMKNQSGAENGEESNVMVESRVNEHIGPIQFNMGGIQVDADDMLQRLKDRQSQQNSDPETPHTSTPPPDGKSQNEALASFFAGLMKRGGGSATNNSPKSTGI